MNASRLQWLVFGFVISWFAATTLQTACAASPIGLWRGADATFEIFETEGTLSAKIVSLTEPMTPEGKEKTDIYNPDPTKREDPIVGLIFISGCAKKSENHWENGTVYDPRNGRSYSCYVDLQDADKIKLRGYIGSSLIGRNYIWTRVN
jgi:uncharacterized protein (DUF2147 family)